MQNETMVLNTQQRVVDHLATYCGIKRNWAQAMVTEYFNFDHDELLLRDHSDDEFNVNLYTVTGTFDDYWLVVNVTGQQAFMWYKDWLTYNPTETSEGITFDGELVYNLEGKYL